MSTKAQLADLLTKALIAARFKLLYSNLQLQELPFQLRGCIGADETEDIEASKSQAVADTQAIAN